jgi:glutathione S-transferase
VRFWLAYSGRPAEDFADQLDAKQAGGYAALDAMEQGLTGRQYLAGGTLSLADVALYAYTHVAHEGDFDLAPYPGIRAWLDRVAAEPGHVSIEA